MATRVGSAFALLAMLLPGCLGSGDHPPYCHASDSEQLYLRDDVDLGAVQQAFVEEGWDVGPDDHAVMAATKERPSMSFEATVSRQESNDTTQGRWDYVLVVLILYEDGNTDDVPPAKVVDVEARLVERLRSLGAEGRSPTPWPADAGSGWNCAKP